MRLILAPMEGVIDHTMRDLLTGLGGLERCVTEFVRVSDALLPPRVFYRYCPELQRGGVTAAGVPVYLQLLGSVPTLMADNAARAAELGAPGIDLNFGCPSKTVNRTEGGSALLRQPERIYAIVDAVRRSVPKRIPVTVKIRLGYEDSSLLKDNVAAIAAARPSELAVHARTRRDGYRPPAFWEQLARVRQWISVPVIANGEIWSVEDALRCRQASGCDDLMLGRGILSRPDLACLIQANEQQRELQALHWPRVQALVLELFATNLAVYPARYVGNPVKQWLAYLRLNYPEAAQLFQKIKRMREADEIRSALQGEQGSGNIE
jgi:tRNA-dihydrouridine synthase C